MSEVLNRWKNFIWMNPSFTIGQTVKVSEYCEYVSDFPGEYIIVSITWEYQKKYENKLNIAIASQEDIRLGYGSTDGFDLEDLLLV